MPAAEMQQLQQHMFVKNIGTHALKEKEREDIQAARVLKRLSSSSSTLSSSSSCCPATSPLTAAEAAMILSCNDDNLTSSLLSSCDCSASSFLAETLSVMTSSLSSIGPNSYFFMPACPEKAHHDVGGDGGESEESLEPPTSKVPQFQHAQPREHPQIWRQYEKHETEELDNPNLLFSNQILEEGSIDSSLSSSSSMQEEVDNELEAVEAVMPISPTSALDHVCVILYHPGGQHCRAVNISQRSSGDGTSCSRDSNHHHLHPRLRPFDTLEMPRCDSHDNDNDDQVMKDSNDNYNDDPLPITQCRSLLEMDELSIEMEWSDDDEEDDLEEGAEDEPVGLSFLQDPTAHNDCMSHE